MPITFFDFDKTLMKGYSGFYTTLRLIQKKIVKKRRIAAAIFYKIISPLYKGDIARMYQMAIDDMAGRTLAEILAIGRDCFEKDVRPRLYPEGVALIRRLKKEGHKIFLVTSGPSMTMEIVAESLGVDGHASAGPIIKAGILQNILKRPLPYREGKVAAAEEILRREGVGWESTSYYADNIDDLFLLEKVAHPVLVNPDRRLRKIGESRAWPTLTWRLG